MRITLDEKLNDIIKDTIEMGSVIQDTVNDAIKALMSGDRDLAQKIIDNDTIIDDYDLTIEEK